MKRTHTLVAKAKLGVELGLSYSEIGRLLGISYQTIRQWIVPGEAERNRKNAAQWVAENRDRSRAYKKMRGQTEHGWAMSALGNARFRASRKTILFAITAADVKAVIPADRKCPALGVSLQFGGTLGPSSASLDRIRPELGYVPGNIAVISYLANTIKQDANSAEIRAVADWLDRALSPE